MAPRQSLQTNEATFNKKAIVEQGHASAFRLFFKLYIADQHSLNECGCYSTE